uniref:Uncharacterized protein n=1 Tax=Onchocerca volvulus TaxID=6282 RepID=A0A8R1TM61_ONCVO
MIKPINSNIYGNIISVNDNLLLVPFQSLFHAFTNIPIFSKQFDILELTDKLNLSQVYVREY